MASEENYKVVLIGETKVGKTCIVNQYCNGNFDPNTPTSLTAQYIKKEIKIVTCMRLTLLSANPMMRGCMRWTPFMARPLQDLLRRRTI